MTELKPSMYQPIVFTIVALGDLVATFYAAYGDPPFICFTIILIAEIALIAIAIFNWVSYFKSYIRYEIEHNLVNKEIL